MKKILATVLAITLALSLAGCKTRGSSGEENSSVSDNSDESSSLIKTGKEEIGKVESSEAEITLTKDVNCEVNTPDNIKLSQITFEMENTDKPVTIDLNKTDLAALQKSLGIRDRGLKNKTSKNKGFIFDGQGYIKTNEGSVTFIESEEKKIKAICFSTEYEGEDLSASICGGIGLWSEAEDVRKKIGYGTYMENSPDGIDVVYYKNSTTTLVLVYENVNSKLAVTEMTIINN